jgi:zinc transport system permease protein
MIDWLNQLVTSITELAPSGTFFSYAFMVKSLVAVILFSLICGSVSSLVVGNRMAFFSDAMAHCSFAGVAIALLLGLFLGASLQAEGLYIQLILPLVMVAFGMAVGLAIAWVRDQTGLASDTVIGVFFAGAIGFGALLFKYLSARAAFDLEGFLFGNPIFVSTESLLLLGGLLVVTVLMLVFLFNPMVFASFNPSLARSRQVRVRLAGYLFIVLLALIVNVCLKIVGALLINAMLIVPAATASYLARNIRQLFWLTTLLTLAVGVGGLFLNWTVGFQLELSVGGTIVVLSVLLFFLAMLLGPWLQARRTA